MGPNAHSPDNHNMVGSEKKGRWFVDISGQIRGPIEAHRVIQELIRGELKVIHRVSQDGKQWRAICNEPKFVEAIEHLIAQLNERLENSAVTNNNVQKKAVGEDTGFHNIGEISLSISEQLNQAKKLEEMKANVSSLRQLLSEINAKKKITLSEQVAKPIPVEEIHPEDKDDYGNVAEVNVWLSLEKLFKKIEFSGLKQNLLLNLMVLLVVGGWLGYAAVSAYFEQKHQQEIDLAREQARQVLLRMSLKEYDQAILDFEKINDFGVIEPKVVLEIAAGCVVGKKYDKAEKLLRMIETTLADLPLRSRLYALQGFLAAQNERIDEAIVKYDLSLKDQENFPALHNLAVLYILKKQMEMAEPLLLKAVRINGVDHSSTFLALFEVAHRLDLEQKDELEKFSRLKKLEQMLALYKGNLNSFHSEMLVGKILSASLVKNEEKIAELASVFMDLDLSAQVVGTLPFDLDFRLATWEHMVSWCQTVLKTDLRSSWKNAFYAKCAAPIKGAATVLPYATYAANTSPEDMPIVGFLANLQLDVGDLTSAEVTLTKNKAKLHGSSKNYDIAFKKFCTVNPSACPKR